MAFKHLIGVDHIVIAVRDLDAAARNWTTAGFTLSPRGRHSANMGTANHTIMLGPDYMELMGIEHETNLNRPTADFLRQREGVERVAFNTDNAPGLCAELRAHGIAAQGPVSFSRPVQMPGGSTAEAAFNVALWPASEAPAGLHLFACQHLTPENVWLPELQQHRNGASALQRIVIIANQPELSAAHMGRLVGQQAWAMEDGWRVPSGPGRASMDFCAPAVFAGRYPEPLRLGSPGTGAAAVIMTTRDITAARHLPDALEHGDMISLPAHRTNGVILSLAAP